MYIIVLITCPNIKSAREISNSLVKSKLAACVNIVKGIESIFSWKGKVDNAKEVLLIVKTKKSLFTKLAAKVQQLHPYEVPEIIALPIALGNKKYLEWIKDAT